MRALTLALAVSVSAAAPIAAQRAPLPPLVPADTSYVPRYEMPNGRQLVVVYVGGRETERLAEFTKAIHDMKPLLAHQAAQRGLSLSIIGVSLDWEVEQGFTRLQSMGAWDEVVLGNNWINVGAQHYLWLRSDGKPITPQVLVFERTINPTQDTGTPGQHRIAFGEERRLAGFDGFVDIIQWVGRGAPLPDGSKP
jgi:hypothetical protein